MFSYATTLGKLKRVFDGFDYSVAQTGVYAKDEGTKAETGPYFYKSYWNRVVRSYFKTNLEPYYKGNYEINSVFSNPYIISGKESNRYQRVTLYFSADFNISFHYENDKSFVIKEKK